MTGTDLFVLPCRKCCGPNSVHYLTCPMLRLPYGWRLNLPRLWAEDLGPAR